MHAVCYEVTGQVIGSRRQRLLHELSVGRGPLGDEQQTVAAMCRALAEDRARRAVRGGLPRGRGRAAAPGRRDRLRRRTCSPR